MVTVPQRCPVRALLAAKQTGLPRAFGVWFAVWVFVALARRWLGWLAPWFSVVASALSLHYDRNCVATAMSRPIGPNLLPVPLLLTRGAVAGWPWCFVFVGVRVLLGCGLVLLVGFFFLATL